MASSKYSEINVFIDDYVSAIMKMYGRHITKDDDAKEYPHKCPRCHGPAYVGLNSVDCKVKCK